MKDNFGFAEHQQKAPYGLGYKLTLNRKSDNFVLNKADATNIGKIIFNAIEGYVPHYTPSISQQDIISKQILSKLPTDTQYLERSVFMEEKNTQNLWSFELATQQGINVLLCILVHLQQRDRQESQNSNNDTFCRSPVTSARTIIEMKRYTDFGITLNYDDDD